MGLRGLHLPVLRGIFVPIRPCNVSFSPIDDRLQAPSFKPEMICFRFQLPANLKSGSHLIGCRGITVVVIICGAQLKRFGLPHGTDSDQSGRLSIVCWEDLSGQKDIVFTSLLATEWQQLRSWVRSSKVKCTLICFSWIIENISEVILHLLFQSFQRFVQVIQGLTKVKIHSKSPLLEALNTFVYDYVSSESETVLLWALKSPFSTSTQTHVLELIKELGLETYQQFSDGKKVYHMGGPGAKVCTYKTSIPALSPLVLLDFTQFMWRVRQQTHNNRLYIAQWP